MSKLTSDTTMASSSSNNIRSWLWYLSIPLMAVRKLRHYVNLANQERKYSRPPWLTNDTFRSLLKLGEGRIHLEEPSAYNILQFASQTLTLPGDAAELGVYRGGTAKMIATIFQESGKQVHLFDTFDGMPETDSGRDIHVAGDFNDTSLESVSEFLGGTNGIAIHQGLFPDTASTAELESARFCFVHVDADIYSSTKNACEFFYPRMVAGGVIIFHDYTIRSCPGVPQAIGEFFADKRESAIFLHPNQALIVKL